VGISRRQLLKRTAATAILAQTHLLARVQPARAFGGNDPILVLVNLDGGNDALNTLIPFDDRGGNQRRLYEQLRPDLTIREHDLLQTSLRTYSRGTGLAFHPNLSELARLWSRGNLALIPGVGVPDSSLSHFTTRDAWYTGVPSGATGTGWIGRHMEASAASSAVPAISFGGAVNLSLLTSSSRAINSRSIAEFGPPTRLAAAVGGVEQRRMTWDAIYAEGRAPGSLTERVARSARLALAATDNLENVDTTAWGSYNDTPSSTLGYDLRDVASILRHDIRHPGDATGLCFFHVTLGGFDTHTHQGTISSERGHGQLMRSVSTALDAFQRDLADIGAADRVVTLVYSEFGRRAYQNGSRGSAGTDHGRGGLAMLMGERVAGGLHGQVPDLADLDDDGNLKITTDYRRIYAALIDDWLGGDHRNVLTGGPFEPLPLLA
jgi:uncharacterized protein (DUF1501 family)